MPIEFSSSVCESKFRLALAGVKSSARIERRTLFLRPLDLLKFGAELNRRGLQNCQDSNRILRFLDANKQEFLRFQHDY